MLPAFLITLREVIEASLIVATILGILVRLGQTRGVRTVWMATGAATLVSVLLIAVGSLFGIKIQEIYTGRIEQMIEGAFMVVSAVFITWAVFFLHKYFASYKTRLLVKIKETVEKEEQKGLFILAFTAVLREGFEIVLFLSTIYFSSDPQSIFTGFAGGAVAGILVSFGFFAASLRLPVFYAFRVTSILLILFAAGLLARGVHEFHEAGFYPQIAATTFTFFPANSFVRDMLKAVFGITHKMDAIQMSVYASYVAFMSWWVFFRKTKHAEAHDHE